MPTPKVRIVVINLIIFSPLEFAAANKVATLAALATWQYSPQSFSPRPS
jgi:hypothetical protein